MSIVVQKYGGSSVATPEKIQWVAERIMQTRDQGHSVVAVVSAMADTTDELLALSRRISDSPERRELDMLLTAGERISMALLSMAIRERGGKAISFTGSQAGILTNDRHVDARIIEVRPVRVQDEIDRGNIVIVAGYQGMSYKREITTLGRGGSDTTAVALAAALDAEWCEICSDVDGVYTADPRIVSSAHRIPELSYEETRELAENGARVLNAQAVEFARSQGIAIYARATAGALPGQDPSRDGTVVRKSPPREPGSVTGIAHETGILWLQGRCPDAETALGALEKFSLPPSSLQGSLEPQEGFRLAARIAVENVHDEAAIAQGFREQFGDELHLVPGLGSVSAVGSGTGASPTKLVHGSRILSDLKPRAVEGAPHRITWILPSSSVADAARRLHAAFIEIP